MSFVKSSIIALVVQFASMLVIVLNRFLFAKYLDPESYGLYNLMTLIATLSVLLAILGFGHAISYSLSKKKINTSQVIYLSTILSCTLGLLISILAYYGLPLLYPGLNSQNFIVILMSVPIMLWVTLTSYIFLSKQKILDYYLINTSQLGFTLFIFILQTLFFSNSLFTSAIYSWFFGSILSIIFVIYKLKSNSYIGFCVLKINKIKKMFNYGIKMYVVSLIELLNYRLDTFIISYLLNFKQLGIYVISVAISDSIGKISHSISLIIFSKGSTLSTSDKNKIVPLVLKITIILTICAVIIIFLIGKSVLHFIFDGKYDESFYPFLILSPGLISISIFRILYHDLASRDLAKYALSATLTSLITLIILDFTLIPSLGLKGASIASTVANSLSATLLLRKYVNLTNIKLRKLLLINCEELKYIKFKLTNFINHFVFRKEYK